MKHLQVPETKPNNKNTKNHKIQRPVLDSLKVTYMYLYSQSSV